MTSDDPRVKALAMAIVALIDGLVKDGPSRTSDDLVPITREALTAKQFEHRAVVRLVERGELRTIKIGRRRYTRASWLAALADRLPQDVATKTRETPMTSKEELIELLRTRGTAKRAVAS